MGKLECLDYLNKFALCLIKGSDSQFQVPKEINPEVIKRYLIIGCSKNYFTPKVITGFATKRVFDENKVSSVQGVKIMEELKKVFNPKTINPLLEELVSEGILAKKTETKTGRKYKPIEQDVYCLSESSLRQQTSLI